MSIKELLLSMPPVNDSNVLLAPDEEMPMILSQRYQKNAANYKFLAPATQNEFSDTIQEPTSSPITRKKRLLQDQRDSVVSGVEQAKSKIPEEKAETTGTNVTEQKELEYAPFKLSSNSSYNPSKLTPRQLQRLDPVTIAKYEAYSTPKSDILASVLKSESRAKTFINEERRKLKARQEEIQRKFSIIHFGHEDAETKKRGEANAQKARDRIKDKYRQIIAYRNSELKCLVEGQSSALEAIRLKEFLTPPPKLKSDKPFSKKVVLRLQELISDR